MAQQQQQQQQPILPRAAAEGFYEIRMHADWLHYDPAYSSPASGTFVMTGNYLDTGIDYRVFCQYPPWLPEEDEARAMAGELHMADNDPAAIPGWQLWVQLPVPSGSQPREPLLWVPEDHDAKQGRMHARHFHEVIRRLELHMAAFDGRDDRFLQDNPAEMEDHGNAFTREFGDNDNNSSDADMDDGGDAMTL